MPEAEKDRKLSRDRLIRILSMCVAVQKRGVDPFEVEVKKALGTLRSLLPDWEVPEDFALDVRTLGQIASVVELQGRWLKRRSTSLYVDPILVELKLRLLDEDSLVNIFTRSWHPVLQQERVTSKRILEAMEYWNKLPTIEEKTREELVPTIETSTVTKEVLYSSRIMSEKAFQRSMINLWGELKERVGREGKMDYWRFIGTKTYKESVRRAYMTSFLVTYGYATVEIDPIDETILLEPLEKQEQSEEQGRSIPISIDPGRFVLEDSDDE